MKLKAKTIGIRLVEESDAGFILNLRLNEKYNSFLSPVRPSLHHQELWIRKYKIEEAKGNQFYFIIARLDGTPCGTVRIYHLTSNSFNWGSWILNENKTLTAAVESSLLVYQFGFKALGFNLAHFDVRKANTSVVSFHKKMGATIVDEDQSNYYFRIDSDTVANFIETIGGKYL